MEHPPIVDSPSKTAKSTLALIFRQARRVRQIKKQLDLGLRALNVLSSWATAARVAKA